MTVAQVEIRTCDRCAAREEIATEEDRNFWGRLWASAIGSKLTDHKLQVIGGTDPGVSVDICPACLKDLMEWWGQRGRYLPVYPDRQAKAIGAEQAVGETDLGR